MNRAKGIFQRGAGPIKLTSDSSTFQTNGARVGEIKSNIHMACPYLLIRLRGDKDSKGYGIPIACGAGAPALALMRWAARWTMNAFLF